MRIIARIVFALAWIAATGAIMEVLPLPGLLKFVVAFLIACALMPIAIVAHEYGHAWAVRRLGGEVVSFTILGVEFMRSAPPADPALTGREIGGHVGYVFEGGESRHEAIRIAAAGPAANLLLAVAAGALALLAAQTFSKPATTVTPTVIAGTPRIGSPTADGPRLRTPEEVQQWVDQNPHWNSRWRPARLLSMILAALAMLSLGTGLANLVPFKGSDGAAIWHASRPAWRR